MHRGRERRTRLPARTHKKMCGCNLCRSKNDRMEKDVQDHRRIAGMVLHKEPRTLDSRPRGAYMADVEKLAGCNRGRRQEWGLTTLLRRREGVQPQQR
jgi:hypothetical protein